MVFSHFGWLRIRVSYYFCYKYNGVVFILLQK
jgi:hypothetical protein